MENEPLRLYTFTLDVQALPDHPDPEARDFVFARILAFAFAPDPVSPQLELKRQLHDARWKIIHVAEALEIDEDQIKDPQDLALVNLARRQGLGWGFALPDHPPARSVQ